jgi:SAM-dependent methyltransferase
MREQRPPGLGTAVDAVAEQLPFEDDSFDAAMAIVTIHQWPDWRAGVRELNRVSRRGTVIVTFDGEALDRLWLGEYVPELFEAEAARYPAIDAVASALEGTVTVDEVPIPFDCTDGFTEAFYGRPEQFLDPEVRRAQSAWGFVEPGAAERGIELLRSDLESGAWDERHGRLRTQPEFVGALRLIAAKR